MMGTRNNILVIHVSSGLHDGVGGLCTERVYDCVGNKRVPFPLSPLPFDSLVKLTEDITTRMY